MTKTLKIFAIGVIMSVAGNTQAMHTYDEVVADETCAIALEQYYTTFWADNKSAQSDYYNKYCLFIGGNKE